MEYNAASWLQSSIADVHDSQNVPHDVGGASGGSQTTLDLSEFGIPDLSGEHPLNRRPLPGRCHASFVRDILLIVLASPRTIDIGIHLNFEHPDLLHVSPVHVLYLEYTWSLQCCAVRLDVLGSQSATAHTVVILLYVKRGYKYGLQLAAYTTAVPTAATAAATTTTLPTDDD